MKKAVIFDLDGTIYYSDHIINGVYETLNVLKEKNINTIFFTNNSSKNRKEIFSKLLTLGIECTINQVYSSTYAIALYLKRNNLNNVFLIGSQSFEDELKQFNIQITHPESAQAVVVGLKTNFNYDDIANGLIAINNNAKLIVSNVDKNFPVSLTELKPGCNAIVSSLLGSIDMAITPIIIGKPSTFLLEAICSDWNLSNNDIIVVGDSIDSDIEMAKRYKCDWLLVGKNGVEITQILKRVGL
jgi:HAD superfamily hydrolase (TIGR01450 family)